MIILGTCRGALKESKEWLEPPLLEIVEPRAYTPQVLSFLFIWLVGTQTMVYQLPFTLTTNTTTLYLSN